MYYSSQTIHDTVKITKVVIDTVRASSKDSMELLYKVDAFYNNAWLKLIVAGTITFTVIGIAIPVYIQSYQNKKLKLSEDRLKANIKLEVEFALKGLQTNFEKNSESNLKKLRTEIYGCLYHVQGVQMWIQKNYSSAFRDFCKAIINYIDATETAQLESALFGLKQSLSHCTKTDVNETLKSMNLTFEKIVAKISLLERTDNYPSDIMTIYNSLKENNLPKS